MKLAGSGVSVELRRSCKYCSDSVLVKCLFIALLLSDLKLQKNFALFKKDGVFGNVLSAHR